MIILVTMLKKKLSLVVYFVFKNQTSRVSFTCWNWSSVGSVENSFSVVDIARQYVQRFYECVQTVVTYFEFKVNRSCFTVFGDECYRDDAPPIENDNYSDNGQEQAQQPRRLFCFQKSNISF